MLWWRLFIAGMLLSAGVLQPAAAADARNLRVEGSNQRLALVIGNDSYRQVRRLDNARADARALARALEAAGFAVTLKLDVDQKGMKQALRAFKAQLAGGDEAVFYFSGHGVQLAGENYLLPVDIEGQNADQIRDDAVSLQRVLDDLNEQKARFALAIIDACRDNPFKGKEKAIGGRGLAATSPATGQMVIYAAGTGQQALDRLNEQDTNPNGLFAREFLKEMNRPGVPVSQVLRNVRNEVVRLARTVGHEQVPALYDQVIGDFYFRPPADVPPPPPPARPPSAPVTDPPGAGQPVVARVEAGNAKPTTDRIARERAVDSTPSIPYIGGLWRDRDHPNNISQVDQDGTGFRFTRRGVLPNGIQYESSGSGTIIVGQRHTSSYSARYNSGAKSTGNCSGVVSADGQSIELSCKDSLLGTFSYTAIR